MAPCAGIDCCPRFSGADYPIAISLSGPPLWPIAPSQHAQDSIAALADGDADFPGSCGRCYDIKCVSGTVYGEL